MTGEQLIDMIGSRFDPTKVGLDTLAVEFTITDLHRDEDTPTHRLTVENSTIHHDTDETEPPGAADVEVTLDRAALVDVIAYPERLDDRITDGSITIDAGDRSVLVRLLEALDTFVSPNLVEP